MDQRRILARDRRAAAIHEAGHLVVARWAGAEIASAWIVQNDNPAPDEKTYGGRVQIVQIGGIDPRRRRMIGVAGAVAEHLGAGGWIEDLWPEDSSISESDWSLAGCEPGQADEAIARAIDSVGRMLRLDGPVWPQVLREARRLVVEARRSDQLARLQEDTVPGGLRSRALAR
jgi:hypothetical protein